VARIRSVHPGFFTDEGVVSVSMTARVCVIGLGIESDDKGIFEWKPLMFKMRLFPADNINMDDLLADLEAADLVRQYEAGGKSYGAIRNFRKFQKPKTPNDIHPAPNEIRTYVGLGPINSETDGVERDPFPQKGEKSPQMEDGGGNRSSEPIGSGVPPTAIDVQKAIFDTGVAILTASGRNDREARSTLGRWRKDFGDSAVLTCLSRCQVEQPTVPTEWMVKALQAERNKQNRQPNGRPADRGPDPIVDALRRATAEAAATERASADPAGGFGTGYALPTQSARGT